MHSTVYVAATEVDEHGTTHLAAGGNRLWFCPLHFLDKSAIIEFVGLITFLAGRGFS